MIKVMIADDQELIRESLGIVLGQNEDMKVTGLAKDGQELLTLVEKHVPDVILMDIRMPVIDGVQSPRAVKEQHPEVKVIVLTTFDDDEYVYGALKYGASGYLLKGVSMQDLAAAIRKVTTGGAIINPDVTVKVVKFFSQMAQGSFAAEADAAGADELTRTECNIANLVGHGLSNKEIAERLALSGGTVRNGLSSALSKLGLRDRTQLTLWAVQTGLVQKGVES